MGATERGKEVVDRDFVRDVGNLQRDRNSLVSFAVQQVIGAETEIKKLAGFDAIGIVIRVARSRGRQGQQRRSDGAVAGRNGARDCRESSAAGETNRYLLVGREFADGESRIGDAVLTTVPLS